MAFKILPKLVQKWWIWDFWNRNALISLWGWQRSLAPGPLWSPSCASVNSSASSSAEGKTQDSVRSLWSTTEHRRVVRHVLTSSLEWKHFSSSIFRHFPALKMKVNEDGNTLRALQARDSHRSEWTQIWARLASLYCLLHRGTWEFLRCQAILGICGFWGWDDRLGTWKPLAVSRWWSDWDW